MTASEAAAAYARERGGGGGDAEQATAAASPSGGADAAGDSCRTDKDCGFTRVGPESGACCPMLCAPRVVSKKHAAALEARIASCTGGRACPQPACRPPPETVIPACEKSRCVGRASESKGKAD